MNQPFYRTATLIFCLVAALTHIPAFAFEPVQLPEPTGLEPLNIKVTQGAAAGYVEDKTCATCHADIYQSYQSVGMSKSFTAPAKDKFIENFDLPPFYHDKSQRYYQLVPKGDELWFKRWQLDSRGREINLFTQQVDFILGSGHKARSYLYREPGGELFQLPIGWYSQKQQWGLSPGYDQANHSGVTRAIPRECLFCHNAFAEVPKGSDEHFQPNLFPEKLPHGTGCQRCHGPGAKHVETVLKGADSIATIHQSIVNPAKLPVDKRDSVCFQCHLLPMVDLVGSRAFTRTDYSFRPGEDINDYIHHIDATDARVKTEDRFEINHHAYRLRSSQCFSKSEGRLTCISCHNPHKKVPVEERAAHYGKVCQSCHDKPHQSDQRKDGDCVACHMPQRRAQDAVNVVMTDHKIQRNDRQIDWLAPLQEQEPIITDFDFLMPQKSPQGDMGQIYKVVTLMRVKVLPNYVDYLQALLNRVRPRELQPYFELARGQLMLKRYADAERSARALMKMAPDHFRPLQWLATALAAQQKYDEAERVYAALFKKRSDLAEIHFNYALLKLAQQKPAAAIAPLEKAVLLRSNFITAWFYLGEIAFAQQDYQKASEHYQKALSIEPAFSRGYIGLANALSALGDNDQAIDYLRHGVKVARQNQEIAKLLEQLSAKVSSKSSRAEFDAQSWRPLLNSERIEKRFGSYGIKVLKQDEQLRIANLFSTQEGGRITRTLAVVSYPTEVAEGIRKEHQKIVSGQSLGAVFKQAGYQIHKKHLYFGDLAKAQLPTTLLDMMGGIEAQSLALHLYRFTVAKDGRDYDYAIIAEIHHPDYLTLAQLQLLYRDVVLPLASQQALLNKVSKALDELTPAE